MLVDRFDGCFAAKSATRSGEHVTGEMVEVDLDGGCQENVECIGRLITFEAGGDFNDVGSLTKDSFAEQKAGGEFLVVARSAHRDSHAAATHTDLQRFFPGKDIGGAPGLCTQSTAGNFCG